MTNDAWAKDIVRPLFDADGTIDRPTALFAANDLSASQVIRTAGELGLTVPGDLSVVGFDNIPESALTTPPLTTVDQSIQQMGHTAVTTLTGMIEHPESGAATPGNITLPTQLVLRGTTAAPKGAS